MFSAGRNGRMSYRSGRARRARPGPRSAIFSKINIENPIHGILVVAKTNKKGGLGFSMENTIQQIAQKLTEKVLKTLETEGIRNIGNTISKLVPAVNETVLEIVEAVIQETDHAITENAKQLRREDSVQVWKRNVPRTVETQIGTLTYSRTYFRKGNEYRYLTDYVIGVEAYERISKSLVAEILNTVPDLSFQKTLDHGNIPLSRQTVHNRLNAVGELCAETKRAEHTPEILHLFADEDHAHLTPKKKTYIPLVMITEGIDTAQKRHRTKNPVYLEGYGMEAETFRENVLAFLTEKYDLSEVKRIYLHSDCGKWILGLAEVLPNTVHVMDGYHLEKRYTYISNLNNGSRYIPGLRNAVKRNDFEAFLGHFNKWYETIDTDDKQATAREIFNYFEDNWEAIVRRETKEVCGSCTEPMVSHVLSERLSRNPISWSRETLKKMAMLVVYSKNGCKVKPEDIRTNPEGNTVSFKENGFQKYYEYAEKQTKEFLSRKLDWSVFEKSDMGNGKIDGVHILRKSVGDLQDFLAS